MHAARWIVVPLLVVALVAQAPVASARRRAPKQSLSALVDGRRVKFGKKLITSNSSAQLGSLTFGGAQKPHRLGQLLHGLVIGCPTILAGGVFPADGMFCSISYSETKFSRNLVSKQWAGVDGITVTVTSFDGTRVTGTFDGTLQPFDPNGGYGPVTLTNGQFDIVISQTP